jgi:hypothetical protein
MPSGSPYPSPVPRIRPTHSSFWLGMISRFGGRSRLNEPRYKLFWQTMAIAASMLIFGALRRSTLEMPDHDSAPVTVGDSRSEELGRKVSGFQARQVEADPAEARLNIANHFVAKDFTNHVKLQAHNTATLKKSDLTPSAQQGRAVQKRVVLN